jgi:excisionase family DNA binding protein
VELAFRFRLAGTKRSGLLWDSPVKAGKQNGEANMKWIEPERFYTIDDTASILNIGRDSVRRLIERGQLPAVKYPKMGGKGKNVKWMILGTLLIQFIELHTKAV